MPDHRLRATASRLTASLLLVGLQAVSAQPGQSIVGRVFDAGTLEPVAARVVLIPDDATARLLMSGVSSGTLYHFDGVPDGDYRVQALGFRQSVRLRVPASDQPEALDLFGRIVAPDLFVRSGLMTQVGTPNSSYRTFLDAGNGDRLLGLHTIPDVIGLPCGLDVPGRLESTSGRIHYLAADRSADGRQCDGAVLVLFRPSGLAEIIPTLESGYEEPAAIVVEQAGNRFRIALQEGSTWVERRDAAGFLPYPALLVGKLSYLRDGWDGRLSSEPGLGRSERVSPMWLDHLRKTREISVDVLSTRTVAGRLWMQVRLEPETCGDRVPGVESVTGWVPAYRPSGATNAWFHSRGC